MAQPVMTETGYTKFNLSYPVVTTNTTLAAVDIDGGDETAPSLPGAFIGVLVPHLVCTLFILARTSSRLFLLRKWFLDDTLILLAWTTATAICALYSITTSNPHPHRTPTIALPDDDTPYTPPPAILRTYASLILYQLTLLLTKLSVLASYHRIFSCSNHPGTPTPAITLPPPPKQKNRTRKRTTPLLVLTLLTTTPLILLSVLQCHPAAGQFFGQPLPQCFSFAPLLLSSAAVHALLDIGLVALLLPTVLRAAREAGSGWAGGVVCCVAGVGGVVVGLVRVAVLIVGEGGLDSVRAGGGWFFVLTVLEVDVAVVGACVPALRAMVAGWRGGEEEEGSVDLTGGVSYRGYPWTREATPAGTPRWGSKNPSVVDGFGLGVPPPPPMPVVLAVQRTPTTLSLRSFVSGMTPKSRGRLEGEDRAGLLGEEGQGGVDGVSSRRRSSVGLEAYYEQFMGHDDTEKRKSRGGWAEARRSRGSQCYSGQWADSQESFVLGMNDPNSPKRLSPMSSLSEAAKAELRRPDSRDREGAPG